MSKNKSKIITLIILITLFSLTPFVSAVNETVSNEHSIMPISDDPEQPVDSINSNNELTKDELEDYFNDTSNSKEDSEETLKESDVYLLGDNVVIDYIIDGNLFIIANSVTINSHITGDAFICANNVTVNENGYIINNLFTICNTLELKGVSYNVYAISENVDISGYVYKDLRVSCKNLTNSGVVHRNIYHNQIDSSISFSVQDLLISIGTTITTCVLIWLLLVWLAPKFEKNTNIIFSKKFLPILGSGLLALIAVPIIALVLIVLGITSTFALLLLSIYFIIIAVSFSLFTIAINNFICKKLNISKTIGIFGILIATSAVISLLTFVPYLGMVISLISVLVGMGYFTTTILSKKEKSNVDTTSK